MRPFRHILSILGVLLFAMNGYAMADNLSFSFSGPKRSGWTYDSHGNVTADPAGSMNLAWNAIGLPRAITGSGSASTQRSYLADGSLAQVSDGSTTRIYLGNMVFTLSGWQP